MDLDAEQAVLAAMMLDQDAALKAAEILDDTMFYKESHRLLFRSMRSLMERGAVRDPVTLRDELSRRGDLNRAGGMEYIAALVDVVPTAAHIEDHAKIVRDKAVLRRLVEAATGIIQDVYEGHGTAVRPLLARMQTVADELASVSDYSLTTDVEWLQEPTPQALIDGLMPAAGHTLIFGAPGSWKTLAALAIVGGIATGTDVFGCRVVSPGMVVFVVGEGHALFPRRLAALRQHLGLPGDEPSGVFYLREKFSLLSPDEVARLLNWTKRHLAGRLPRLFVIDPLASLMSPGDENNTPDMNLVTASLNRIRAETGAATLTSHHTGWNFERERGSIALRAAMDAVYSLKRDGDAAVLECVKMRDGAVPEPRRLQFVPVLDSGIVVLAGAPADTDIGGLSKSERAALDALVAVAIDDRGATSSEWEHAARDAKSQIGRGTFFRARKRLVDLKLVRWDKPSKRYSLTGAGISRAVPSPK